MPPICFLDDHITLWIDNSQPTLFSSPNLQDAARNFILIKLNVTVLYTSIESEHAINASTFMLNANTIRAETSTFMLNANRIDKSRTDVASPCTGTLMQVVWLNKKVFKNVYAKETGNAFMKANIQL